MKLKRFDSECIKAFMSKLSLLSDGFIDDSNEIERRGEERLCNNYDYERGISRDVPETRLPMYRATGRLIYEETESATYKLRKEYVQGLRELIVRFFVSNTDKRGKWWKRFIKQG